MQVRPSAIKLRLHVFLMLLAIAGGAALALFSNSAANRAAAQSNELDKIVFGQDGQILVVNPDGSGLVPFGAGFDPSWSTTNTGQGKIAFGYGPSEISRIAIMNEDGSNVVELVPNEVSTRTSQPALSPDATKVALVNEVLETDPGQPAQAIHSRIYIVDADGQNFRPLFTGISSGVDHEVAPAWSPDGTRIAFIGQKSNGASDLYVVDANGQAPPFKITNLADGRFSFGQLSWSPDGQRLAFGYALDVHLVNADGSGGLINLTNSPLGRDDTEPAWSPDGQKIAYSSNDSLQVMDVDGQNQISLNIAGREPSWRWRTVTPEEPPPSPTPAADIAVQLSATSGAVVVGQNLTYTMTVRNNGNSSAENVEATLLRSASLEFVSVTPTQASCDPNGNPVTCQLASSRLVRRRRFGSPSGQQLLRR